MFSPTRCSFDEGWPSFGPFRFPANGRGWHHHAVGDRLGLAGWLGAALLTRLVGLGWALRAPKRVVKVTEAGWAGLAERLGVDLDAAAEACAAPGSATLGGQ